jgi:membrane protein implicated in regulation of membrane protease activity
MALAALLLAIPIVGLLWVGSYASVEPVVAGFPFFIWYQFVWVFLCSACTAGALRMIRIARRRRPGAGR